MAHKLVFRPQAKADLKALHDYIAEHAGLDIAASYLGRIELACRQLTTFPERGTVRTELGEGIRIIGFERRTSIAFRVEGDTVRILRLLHGGRDFPDAWDDN
ncbi:type II toxin-antitoxin system RelE/ParE family toxin [Rhizobium sp. DKSPLA3]|uniref:Type II toxin-antitoxin system RelE/ParE family toxin n=1 Tax=Rhizobium quercicola TaxID=2901226 RepID=A0A9X1T3C5_9HYPH|nr:type II toxin-antitoxin system RelE/ParE family toxin [Rhizobium quercicola]